MDIDEEKCERAKRQKHQFLTAHHKTAPFSHTHTRALNLKRKKREKKVRTKQKKMHTYQLRGHVLLSCCNHCYPLQALLCLCRLKTRRAAALLSCGAFSASSASRKFVLGGLVVPLPTPTQPAPSKRLSPPQFLSGWVPFVHSLIAFRLLIMIKYCWACKYNRRRHQLFSFSSPPLKCVIIRQ